MSQMANVQKLGINLPFHVHRFMHLIKLCKLQWIDLKVVYILSLNLSQIKYLCCLARLMNLIEPL